jgi:glycosyltransferase involved in cell wall biosynthesis
MIPTGSLTLPGLPFEAAVPPAAQSYRSIEMVRVLHVINGEFYAGAERVQDLLAMRLPELGFAVDFASVKLDLFDELRESHGSRLYDISMRSRYDFRAAARIARLIRRGGYCLVHAHSVRTALVGGMAAAWAHVPMVYHAHSPASHDSTQRVRDRFNGLVERWSLRRAARVIAVSRAIAEHIANEGFDRSRIVVVPNGVPSEDSFLSRTRPSGVWTLGTVALFRPRKGLEVLLDAMDLLRRQGLSVRLRAVGSFESARYESEIVTRVRRLNLGDQITWTGFTRDVGAELRKMDLFVLPSLFGEGLPMVVLEAMTAGVPIAATRVAGVPEAIRHGQDGVLADPGDPFALAGAIAGIVRGGYDWSALRESARERHAECFSDRAMAAGVASVYRQVLSGPPEQA